MTIQAAIIGATGYAGIELVRLLSRHPQVNLKALSSHSYVGQSIESVYPQLRNQLDAVCQEENLEQMAETTDVVFLALPHGHAAQKVTEFILAKTKIIDLGADFRLKDPQTYETWYNLSHGNPTLLKSAVFGLSEWNRDAIRKARLLANPGCYPTCSLLGLLPLLKEDLLVSQSLIIDAKSGVTGAGRAINLPLHYSECSETVKAYGLASHRHTPEIEQGIEAFGGQTLHITFTPHLMPMNRGMLVTAYAQLQEGVQKEDIQAAYQKTYLNEPFIRLLPEDVFPETRWVKGSNFCDINFKIDPRTNRIIMMSAIDNLGKGAAGQAIQNMNLMFGFPETDGLDLLPAFPI